MMLIRRWLFGLLAVATVAALAFTPASLASANVLPPDGGSCGNGLIVTPSQPSNGDWPHGTDLKLWNCSKSKAFANVLCHPWPSFIDDSVCGSYVLHAGETQVVSVNTLHQVHAVVWYH